MILCSTMNTTIVNTHIQTYILYFKWLANNVHIHTDSYRIFALASYHLSLLSARAVFLRGEQSQLLRTDQRISMSCWSDEPIRPHSAFDAVTTAAVWLTNEVSLLLHQHQHTIRPQWKWNAASMCSSDNAPTQWAPVFGWLSIIHTSFHCPSSSRLAIRGSLCCVCKSLITTAWYSAIILKWRCDATKPKKPKIVSPVLCYTNLGVKILGLREIRLS